MKKVLCILGLMSMVSSAVLAQVVSTDVAYFTVEDSINLTFDATQGNGNLNGTTPVYIHTGVITPNSDHKGDWQKQVSLWGQADPDVQMNAIGGNQHTIGINIGDFYGVSSGNQVKAMAMVFRNADGSVVGQNADGSDIFIPVFETTTDLDAVIMDPIVPGTVIAAGDPLSFNVRTNNSSSLVNLYQDGALLGQGFGDDVSAALNTTIPGKYYLSYTAEVGGETLADTTYYVVRPDVIVADPPAGVEPGINFVNSTTVTLCLWAPFKEHCYAIGDFSNWEVDPAYMMNRSLDGERYWITLNNVSAGQEYRFQYFVDGQFKVADPYSYKILEQYSDGEISPLIYPDLIPYPVGLTSGNVSVFQTDMPEYQWQVNNFTSPAKEDLVIYELLIRDFTLRKDFIAVRDSLPYLKRLGINALQLMPIMEFEGNNSWGYNPIFNMAVDKKYGPADNLKELIDACHAEGIAVILDIVPNHAFGRNPYVKMYWDAGQQRPAWNSPYHNPGATHPFSVGYDYNHQSGYVQTMWHRIFRHWIEEFRVDGYRMDLTKGITQNCSMPSCGHGFEDIGLWSGYDQSRVDLLFMYSNEIWSYKPDFHVIFEHLSDNAEETVFANGNIMLWSKATDQYNEATMGWSGNSDWGWQMSYQAKGWNLPRSVGYMESHDEERLMYKNVNYGNATAPPHLATDTATALYRMQGAGAMFFLIPGPKMIWQFGELGYDFSINWPSETEISRTAPKPVRWNYLWEEPRQKLNKVWSALIKLKHEHPVYSCTTYGLDLGGTGKRMWLSHPDMNVSATCNFDVTGFDMTPDFQHTGTWYNYFTGEPYEVNATNQTLYYEPGQYYVFTDQPLPIPDTTFTPLVEEPDGVAEPTANDVKVYPNPTGQWTLLEFTLDGEELQSVEVIDMMGRKADQLDINSNRTNGLNRFKWDASEFEAGQYSFRITTDKMVRTSMVVVQP